MTDLWRFASACYAQPGIEALCLEQQARGADVCILLCGAWLERRGVGFDSARMEELIDLADDWQQRVIRPLRQHRQAWKEPAQADAELALLRERLKSLELEAERVLLARLERLTRPWPSGKGESAWLDRLVAEPQALARLRSAARAVG
ncbi:TIGR02444 family protein [Stutzerimonas tarimensis]|uniref:TIGR02444 family protein n=1 Tax=Stutzerimonas tarimensis TaxID=1507735 RepID=A0ABV7T538_9GAMM